MNSFKYNQADMSDIKDLFANCAFDPPLDTYIHDVDKYIDKIITNSERIEIWNEDGQLVALLSCYINNPVTKKAFITMISVSQNYAGAGLGKSLLAKAISLCIERKFDSLDLEVNEKNSGAVHLYKKYGFIIKSTSSHTHLMQLTLKGKNT